MYEKYLQLKNYKPRGIEEQLRGVKQYLFYIEENNIDMYHIGIKDAESYREYLRLLTDKEGNTRYNPKTVNAKISFLRMFYNYLTSTGQTLRNPFLNVDKVRESYTLPKNILTIEQIEKLLKNITVETKEDFKFKTIIEILYSTGARISEIENLTRENIDLEKGYLQVLDDKERQNRNIVLTEYALDLLRLYMKYLPVNSVDVFSHGASRTLNRWLNNRLKALTIKLKLPYVTCHGLRHTVATHLLKNGADIREVQEYIGHKKIKNTEIYTHIFPDDLKSIVEANHPREKEYTE